MQPILYIHGFASSGHSLKGQVLKHNLPQVYTPSLSHIPDLALETLEEMRRALGRPLLIGSSLGGYYALHLSHTHQLPAVLINPVIRIDLPLTKVVGLNNHYYDGSRFEFTEQHLHALAGLEVERPDTSHLLLLVQMGDELLDHSKTLKRLAGAQTVVEEGGDHAYQHFEAQLPAIARFAAEQQA